MAKRLLMIEWNSLPWLFYCVKKWNPSKIWLISSKSELQNGCTVAMTATELREAKTSHYLRCSRALAHRVFWKLSQLITENNIFINKWGYTRAWEMIWIDMNIFSHECITTLNIHEWWNSTSNPNHHIWPHGPITC